MSLVVWYSSANSENTYIQKSTNRKFVFDRNFKKKKKKNSNEKVSQFKNASKVKDSEIFEYLKEHAELETRKEFKIGFYRLKRVQRQIGLQ